MYRFLAEHRLRLFPDGLFADLFGGRGRPSVPGSVIAVEVCLTLRDGLPVFSSSIGGWVVVVGWS